MQVSLAFLLLLAASAVFVLSVVALFQRRRRGLPRGEVVYSDADSRARPLVSPRRPLSGKPDYVLRIRGGWQVPVEFKSYRYGAQPPHPDLIQLGAYLVLLDDLHDRPPPYGVLRYRDRALRIPYTPALREEVLRLLEAVRTGGGEPPEGTDSAALCRACPFQPICADGARWR